MRVYLLHMLLPKVSSGTACHPAVPLCHQAQLLEAKKQLETQNILQQKTKELLRTSEQQVTALKTQLASASSSEAGTATPVTRPAALRAPLRGKVTLGGGGGT